MTCDAQMTRFDPAEPFADFLRKRRGRSATPRDRHFDNYNVEAGIAVDQIATQETADYAIHRFRWVGGCSDAVLNLQLGLGTVLSLTNPHREWDLPDTKQTHELLGGVYKALGNAIIWLSDEIEIEHLSEGMLAAARLVRDIDNESFGSDRHKDDQTRVKILINYARVAEHRQDIERRRRDRERGTIDQMLVPENAPLFG